MEGLLALFLAVYMLGMFNCFTSGASWADPERYPERKRIANLIADIFCYWFIFYMANVVVTNTPFDFNSQTAGIMMDAVLRGFLSFLLFYSIGYLVARFRKQRNVTLGKLK